MALVDRDCVRRLLAAPDPDTALVYVRGECVVLPDDQIDADHRGLVITRRQDLMRFLPGGTVTERQVEVLADRLDNTVRDLGA